MIPTLAHWHKPAADVVSEHVEPPLCCSAQMSRVIDHETDAAVHAERQRVVNTALDHLDVYAAGAGPLLDDPDLRRVFDTAVGRCRELLLATGCICPRLEVTGFGDARPQYIAGLDARCGVHHGRNRNDERSGS